MKMANNKNRRNRQRGARNRGTSRRIDAIQSRKISHLENNSAVMKRPSLNPRAVSNTTTINKILVLDVVTAATAGQSGPTPLAPGTISVLPANTSGSVTYSILMSWFCNALGFSTSAAATVTLGISSFTLKNVTLWGTPSTSDNAALIDNVSLEIPPLLEGEAGCVATDSGGRNSRSAVGISPTKYYWVSPGHNDDVVKSAFVWRIGSALSAPAASTKLGTFHISVTAVFGPTRSETPALLTSSQTVPMDQSSNIHIPPDIAQLAQGIQSIASGNTPFTSGSLRRGQLQRPPLQGSSD